MGCCSFLTDWVENAWDAVVNIHEEIFDTITEAHKDIVEAGFRVIGITDETIYLTQVATQRLIPDPQPSFIQKILFSHAIKNTSIAEGLHKHKLTGVAAGIQRFLQYGQNEYIHGIPTASLWYHEVARTAVDDVLDAIAGAPTTLDLLKLQILEVPEWVHWYLQENTAYQYDTRQITVGIYTYDYHGFTTDGVTGGYDPILSRNEADITTVYLETTRVTVAGSTTITVRERTIVTLQSTGGVLSDTYAAGSYVTVEPGDPGDDGTVQAILTQTSNPYVVYHDVGFQIPAANNTDFHFTAIYHLDSAPAVQFIWVYNKSTGVYPTLNNVVLGALDSTLTLPIVALRTNFINISDNPDPAEYSSAKALLNILGLNVDSYIDAINENEDLAYVEDAAIMFGINVYTDTQHGLHGLYNLFVAIWERQDVDRVEYDSYPAGTNAPTNTYSVVEGRFNNVVQFNYIEHTVGITGVIGNLGEFTSFITILPNSAPHQYVDGSTGEIVEDGGNVPQSKLTIRWQDTPTTYTELVVSGLIMTTTIFTTGSQVRAHLFILEDEATPNNNRHNFVIPFSLNQTQGLTTEESEALIYEAMVLVIYANQSVRLRYYETQAFTSLLGKALKIAAIVTFAVSLGTASSASSFLWAFGEQLLYQFVLTYVFTEILEHNTSDGVRAAAIIAYAYLSYKNFSSHSALELSFSGDMLAAIRSITDALYIDQSVQMEALQEEIALFTDLAAERDEMLKDAWDGLDNKSGISRYDVLRVVQYNPYETPSDFYQRTIHTTNPGVQVFDEITNYYSNALALPQL